MKVLTYNIHHAGGYAVAADQPLDGAEPGVDLERIAHVIRAEQPDIVCLQELDRFWQRSGMVDQPAELAKLLDMQVCFAANMRSAPDAHSDVAHEYGVATLTSYPILRCETYALPVEDAWEPRGVLDTRIDVPGLGEVAVLNTHLQSDWPSRNANGGAQRQAQAKEVASYVGAIDVPVILVGDFNAERGGGEIDPLVGEAAMLVDTLAGTPEEARSTYPCGPGRPSEKGIDYILVSEAFAVTSANVVRNNTVVMASDHYPVAAELAIKGAGR